VSGNKASYRPGTVRIPEDAVINIKNRSFTLTAELENANGGAEGVLVTVGGETGGYALVVQDATPKQVAEGRIDKTVPIVFSTDDTFDVGADWGTPVSPTCQPPFEFTDTLEPEKALDPPTRGL
jgi:hypothetical protein